MPEKDDIAVDKCEECGRIVEPHELYLYECVDYGKKLCEECADHSSVQCLAIASLWRLPNLKKARSV
jgi:hypothetical protein